jgi:23S rRNA (uracil1939-C5)-methyltransferase
MDSASYRAWKRAIVETAFHNRGLNAPVDELIDAHGAGRRRATFHVVRTRRGSVIGFAAVRSHQIVSIDACPILAPELGDALPVARQLAEVLGGGSRFDIQFTASDSGVDAHVTHAGPPDLDIRQKLAEIAEASDLARIAMDGETIIERRSPRVRTGDAMVAFPPGAFLQATQAGEQALADLVCAHVGDARRIADLFSGVGPFALRLARTAPVYAADGDAGAIGALDRAARAARTLRPITTEVRDLQLRPLQAVELAAFDAVVFDPPRAGAEAQARALTTSRVRRIAAVSCDPATFARDMAILIGGGYRLERVCPIDQFKWSPHVEIVGMLGRE